VGFYFSFEFFSFQVHDPFFVPTCLPFLASGLDEQGSSTLRPYDGGLYISLSTPCFKGMSTLCGVCFQFQWQAYVQWHQLMVIPFVSDLAFVHHVKTISVSKCGKLDVTLI
jgi:hypothetical protein